MAKALLKYTGTGLFSKGTKFDPLQNGGLYEVEKEEADYLLHTFPRDFTIIEKSVSKEDTTTPTKKPARKRRKKSDEVIESSE